jgi:hypothetical protein
MVRARYRAQIRYLSVVENRRCGRGRAVQRQLLYLGEDQRRSAPTGFMSYTWGDRRTSVFDRLWERRQHGWHIPRESNVLASGDLDSEFMKRIRSRLSA